MRPYQVPQTFRQLLDLWPTRSAVARRLRSKEVEISDKGVRAWHSEGRIPEPYWHPLVEVATEDGFEGISYALLSRFPR